MAIHDYNIANQTGASFRADLNAALSAIVSNNSNETEPTSTFAFMWWMDTTANILKLRNAANNAWLEVLKFNSADAVTAIAALGSLSAVGLQFFNDPNTGFYSPGADLLGGVVGGVELFRLIYNGSGTNNSYLELLGNGAFKTPSGTVAQRPSAPVNGMIRYNSDQNKFEGYQNAAWRAIGGGGGGGAGFKWNAVLADSAGPLLDEEFGEQVYKFMAAQTQNLYASIKVPQSYEAGTPISLYVSAYSPSSADTILLQAQSTLIKPGTDAFNSTTNQRTTTNSALTNTVANRLREFILDITDSSGQINGQAVAAGDIIKVRLYRGSDTDTADLRMIPNSTDLKSTT